MTNREACAIIKVQKRDNKGENKMKTYTVSMKTKKGFTIEWNFEAKSAATACLKAVLHFHDLGARLNTITSVVEA